MSDAGALVEGASSNKREASWEEPCAADTLQCEEEDEEGAEKVSALAVFDEEGDATRFKKAKRAS